MAAMLRIAEAKLACSLQVVRRPERAPPVVAATANALPPVEVAAGLPQLTALEVGLRKAAVAAGVVKVAVPSSCSRPASRAELDAAEAARAAKVTVLSWCWRLACQAGSEAAVAKQAPVRAWETQVWRRD